MPVFVEAGPECIGQFGALVDEPLSSAKQNGSALLLSRLWLDEAHFWTLGRDHDGLCVGRIVLLTLDERLHVVRGNQLHLMAKHDHLAGPLMRAATCLLHNCRRWLLGHEIRKAQPRQFLPKLWLPCNRRAMNLKNSLCQIHPNHHIFCHGCRPFRSVVINTTFLAHRDAVCEGGYHPIFIKIRSDIKCLRYGA